MSSLGNPSSNGQPSTYGCRTDVDGRPLEDGLGMRWAFLVELMSEMMFELRRLAQQCSACTIFSVALKM